MIKINEKKNCSGCMACYNACPVNAISFIEDELGFKYPIVDETRCIQCGKCNLVCPIESFKEEKIETDQQAFAVINLDEEVRLKSSSGGIFSLLAEYVIKQGGVVFGATFDAEFNVVHSYIEDLKDLDSMRGSKYVQSSIWDTYAKAKEFLEEERVVLYTGTPCQIAGLNSFLGKRYDNLYMQDLICHGVPSLIVWKKYLEYRKKVDGQVPNSISFRDKEPEWAKFSMKFQYDSGVFCETHKENLYMKAFLKNICLRDSCYACHFKTLNRVADITLADFWGIDNVAPDMNDKKGTSLVILNSKKGRELFDLIEDKIKKVEVDLQDAIRDNSAAIKSVNLHEKRGEFIEEIDKTDIDVLIRKYCIVNK